MCSPFHSKCRCIYLLELDLDPSGLTGLEPAASALTGRCSDQLNYNPSEVYGIHILNGFRKTFSSSRCNRDTNDILTDIIYT